MEYGILLIESKDEDCKIFVGGLSKKTDERKLKKYFEKYGTVEDVKTKRHSDTQVSRGFGFVLFKKPRYVERVMSKCTHKLDG